MLSEALMARLTVMNNENNTIVVNESNAYSMGMDITELRNRF